MHSCFQRCTFIFREPPPLLEMHRHFQRHIIFSEMNLHFQTCTPFSEMHIIFRNAPRFQRCTSIFRGVLPLAENHSHFQTCTPISEMRLHFQRSIPIFRDALLFSETHSYFQGCTRFQRTIPVLREVLLFPEMHPYFQRCTPFSETCPHFQRCNPIFQVGKHCYGCFWVQEQLRKPPPPQPQICTKQLGTAIRAALLRNQNRDAVLPSRPRPELAEEVTQARGKDLRVLSALCFCPSKGTRQGHLGSLRGSPPVHPPPPPRARQCRGESRDMSLESKCPQ